MENYFCCAIKPLLLVYIVYIQVIEINSKTSILWKLNVQSGKIDALGREHIQLPNEIRDIYENDLAFKIISSTIRSVSCDEGIYWNRQAENDCSKCSLSKLASEERSSVTSNIIESNNGSSCAEIEMVHINGDDELDKETLDCGKAINFTYYDDLIGIAQRYNHPIVPEPEVAYQFLKNKQSKNLKNFNIDVLEKRLKKAKREKPLSVHLFNQIGNFWRIKGDATKSIDCFRRALSMSPSNAEVLHNLARVLFNLQYLDDAIHLTRRSLEVQPPERNAWRQYFTLGEIFKAYGHFQQSILHLRHALDLHPQYEPIQNALRDVENIPSSSLHVYTFVIIVCLVIGVLLVILSTNDTSTCCPNETAETNKSQRHFNRAMAMRSLKGLTPRSKHRKF